MTLLGFVLFSLLLLEEVYGLTRRLHNGDSDALISQYEQSVYAMSKFLKGNESVHLKIARTTDKEDCLLRIICEISSNSDDPSESDFVRSIRARFRPSNPTIVSRSTEDNTFPYQYAGYIGRTSGSAEKCLDTFPVCSLNSELLLRSLNNAPFQLNESKSLEKSSVKQTKHKQLVKQMRKS